VPDSLSIQTGTPSTNATVVKSIVYYRGTSRTILLEADGSSTASGGPSDGGLAFTANQFTASGFFRSTAGQNGIGGNYPGASSTTFLSAGANNTSPVTANYGYAATASGFFQMQPIIVGTGGAAASLTGLGKGGIGCGGGSTSLGGTGGGAGGPGMVLIASW